MDTCGATTGDYYNYGDGLSAAMTRFLAFKQMPGCLLSDLTTEKPRKTECLDTCKTDPETFLRQSYQYSYTKL